MRHRRPTARRLRRAFLALLALATIAALPGFAGALTTDDAPTTWTWQVDQQGPDDEPGQKDLTAHAAALEADGSFWVTWKWDDTRFSGNNSGDACSLFDTSLDDGLVDAAVCVTVKGVHPEMVTDSPRVYLCDSVATDRCFGATLVGAGSDLETACSVDAAAAGAFGAGDLDTQAVCNIDLAELGTSVPPLLRSTCSYPSQEPNSDPSDCVLARFIPPIATAPTTSAETRVSLEDAVTLPSNAAGTVTFTLYADDPATADTLCDTEVYATGEIPVVGGAASSVDDPNLGAPGPYTATITEDTTYSWEAHYTSAAEYYLDADAPCGETTTVTVATVSP